MSFKPLTPRMRQIPSRKSAVLSVLDVGASKVVSLIARLTPMARSDTLPDRTHRCKVLGIGHQRSRGVKAGAIVDLDAAENAIRLAIDAAERMAGVEVDSVVVNMSGGRLSSQLYDAKIALRGKAVGERDIHRVLEAASAAGSYAGRSVLHAVPTGFWLDATRGVRDPKGMIGDELGAEMHVASCDAAAARNLMLAIERCHLRVAAMVATPYAAGLSTLVDDEVEMGAALIDFGGGSTTVGVFVGGRLVHVDAVAVGGNHVTMDVARGLSVSLTDAERLKTLYGACIASPSDDRDSIAVHRVGDDMDHPSHLPKSELVRIIRPRIEEILELVRDRLEGGRTRRPCRTPTRAYRRRLPADRPAGTRSRHRFEPGAHRQTPRRRRVAGIGQESGFRRGGRPHGLSASGGNRTFRAASIESCVRRRRRRIRRSRRAMVEREFLMRAGGARQRFDRKEFTRLNRRRRASKE